MSYYEDNWHYCCLKTGWAKVKNCNHSSGVSLVAMMRTKAPEMTLVAPGYAERMFCGSGWVVLEGKVNGWRIKTH